MITNLLDDKRHHSQMLYKNQLINNLTLSWVRFLGVCFESSRVFSYQDPLDFTGASFVFVFCFCCCCKNSIFLDKISRFSRALIQFNL